VLAGTGGQSAVIPEGVAAELDVLASRVRRMSPRLRVTPSASNPAPIVIRLGCLQTGKTDG